MNYFEHHFILSQDEKKPLKPQYKPVSGVWKSLLQIYF